MTKRFDVIVVGGGIVGLTAALAMAKRHYSVAVIDTGSLTVDPLVIDLRVYAINQASQTLLQQLNAWQHLDMSRVSPYQHMHVWDATNGSHIEFDSRVIAAPNLGAIIEESVLKHALLKEVSASEAISLFPNNTVHEINDDEDSIKVSSETHTWEGQLLMIADGANSPSRQKLKVALTSWSYNQNALVAMVHTEKPHENTAYQVFNPDGPLAFLPLANSHQCSIVWSTDTMRAQNLMKLDEAEFNAQLNQAFAHRLGETKIISARHKFPLQMRHVKQYAGARWLLLGDAAHTIHPLAGLGLNVGLADVAAWLKCLDKEKGVLVSRKMLGAYQRERKHAVWQIIALMEGFKRIFSQSLLPVTSLRGIGLTACNNFAPLKRLFIQHAAGV